ncbi:hypothetical protein L6452_26269 [Arctium lappa]|uniref:Uncharacterized protein n=1 Tax=Arctium lappa TaxID=4217 RepID=A0ACB9ABY2_ARCLA|nr:hypothetical protein L6452_26269 [Arctium lappa]
METRFNNGLSFHENHGFSAMVSRFSSVDHGNFFVVVVSMLSQSFLCCTDWEALVDKLGIEMEGLMQNEESAIKEEGEEAVAVAMAVDGMRKER